MALLAENDAPRPTISLLHATFHRQGGPLEIKDAWLASADHPERVEYIFAMDADDIATVGRTEGHHRVVSPAGDGRVTSVRNWNAAAALATGDLLMVIADDLFPAPGWDTALLSLIGPLDPSVVSYTVKVGDSPEPS